MATDEFKFCKICKRHHSDGRKHIYSKKHREKLDVVLKKFGNKVHEARVLLQKPTVMDGELEPGGKMWCYCCEQEIGKHVTDGRTSVQLGGLIEHMTNSDHHKNTRRFWWENGADKAQLQKFILFEAELERFKTLVSEKVNKLDAKREKKSKLIAEQIQEKEIIQQSVAREVRHSTPQPLFTASITTAGQQVSGSWQSSSSIAGNVHTGAIPPWLIEDNDTNDHSKPATIGPSEDDFFKWKEKQERIISKGKRNPKRVGADFHQTLKRQGLWDNDDDNWLPNFGRVWNAGPRSHSKMEFKSECSVSVDPLSSSLPSHSSSLPSHSSPSFPDCSSLPPHSSSLPYHSSPSSSLPTRSPSPVSVQPYKRRRPLKRSRPDSNNGDN